MSIPNTGIPLAIQPPLQKHYPTKVRYLPIAPSFIFPSTRTPTTTSTTALLHRRRPNRPTLLLRPRIPKRIPEIPPFGLDRASRSSRTATGARILDEIVEAIRGASRACLYGFGGLGGGEAGGGCEVCFCYLDVCAVSYQPYRSRVQDVFCG